MKNLKTFFGALITVFVIIFGACKNLTSNKDTDSTQPKSGTPILEGGGCLAGNEFRAEGKLTYDGKPPIKAEIQLLTEFEGKPIIIAKDVAFNADGTFRLKAALPEGIKKEQVHDIRIAFDYTKSVTEGRLSLFSGAECEGNAYSPPLINHDILDKPSSKAPDIEIKCDEKGNMTWGNNIKIKDFDDFKQQMTAELKRLQQEGAKELPDCITSGWCNDKVFTIFYEVKAEVLKASSNVTPTAANKPIIVQFAKGKSDAALTHTISPESAIEFVINAKKGQTMSFTIGYDFKDSDIEGFLTEPNMKNSSLTTGPKKPNEFKIKTSGNHHLKVRNTTKKNITTTLYIMIE